LQKLNATKHLKEKLEKNSITKFSIFEMTKTCCVCQNFNNLFIKGEFEMRMILSIRDYVFFGLLLALLLVCNTDSAGSDSTESVKEGFTGKVKVANDTPIAELKQLVDKEVPEALWELSNRYVDGRDGCNKDQTKADDYLTRCSKLADSGNATAQLARGTCLWKGIDVPRNQKEAIEWISKSAAQNNEQAEFLLGNIYAGDNGFNPDYKKAVKHFQRSAELGFANAQNFLALCYFAGSDKLGIPQDLTKAAQWLRKSAEQGNDTAQTFLAGLYMEGKGVPQDRAEGEKWFRKAAAKGNKEAKEFVERLEKEKAMANKQQKIDKTNEYNETAEIRQLYEKFENGDTHSIYKIGCIYRDGKGVPVNFDKAEKCFVVCSSVTEMFESVHGSHPNGALYRQALANVKQRKSRTDSQTNTTVPRPAPRPVSQTGWSSWKKPDRTTQQYLGQINNNWVGAQFSLQRYRVFGYTYQFQCLARSAGLAPGSKNRSWMVTITADFPNGQLDEASIKEDQ
jgi:TPR repeat protein